MELTLIIGFTSVIASVVASAASLSYWLGRKFALMDSRFRQVDERFKQIDDRFRQVDDRIEGLEQRLRQEIRSSLHGVTGFVQALYGGLIDFMAMKGLFTPEERDYLVKEAERLSQAYYLRPNPLRPEEAEFILKVMREVREKSPRELDLSKLDRIMEIANRWFWEDKCFEAAKLWATIYTLKRILQKERGEL